MKMAVPVLRYCILLLVFITLASVTGQTFQYSRGWTNGKRDGHKGADDTKEFTANLERLLNPCQIKKLKYILEGKRVNDKFFAACDYLDEDDDVPAKRPFTKVDRNQEMLDSFL